MFLKSKEFEQNLKEHHWYFWFVTKNPQLIKDYYISFQITSYQFSLPYQISSYCPIVVSGNQQPDEMTQS